MLTHRIEKRMVSQIKSYSFSKRYREFVAEYGRHGPIGDGFNKTG